VKEEIKGEAGGAKEEGQEKKDIMMATRTCSPQLRLDTCELSPPKSSR